MRHHATRPAFTLVELLVVITIVSLLMTILLPVFSQARETAIVVACQANQRQMGVAIAAYSNDNHSAIPSCCNNPDSVDSNPASATYGMSYRNLGTGYPNLFTSWMNSSPYAIRGDAKDSVSPASTDYTWRGLGIVWANGYIPFDIGSAKILWCPGENKGAFYKAVPGVALTGPGYTWSGVADHQWDRVPGAGIGTTINYGYRCLTGTNNSSTGPANTSIKWDISDSAKRVAVVDYAVNTDNVNHNGTLPVYTHGLINRNYAGLNRLWYDGHVKWMPDPSSTKTLWGQAMPGGYINSIWYGNVAWETEWLVYDTN